MRNARPLGAVLGVALVLLLVLASAASAATRTIEFYEVEEGSTFAYVDNAPKSKLKHGFPAMISAGDEIVIVHPLDRGANKIGRLAVTCTATATAKSFDQAGFLCHGTFILGTNGTMTAEATIGSSHETEGAITGGTGAYADARGTFVTKEGGRRSKITITLVE